MAKEKTGKEDEVVAPAEETKELVRTRGVGAELFDDSAGGLFVPIRDDLPIEQRREAVRQVLQQSMMADEKLALVKGEMLFEACENSYWKEWTFKPADEEKERSYASWEEYCKEELNLNKRAGQYLISIYKKFVVELELPKNVLKDLQWAKAKEFVSIITAENAADYFDKMSSMTLAEVRDFVKQRKRELKGGEGTAAEHEPTEVKKSITFKLNPDQLDNVEGALKIAESLTSKDDRNAQLDMICTEFKAGTVGMGVEGALTKLDIILKDIERAYGVKLDVKELTDSRYDSSEDEKEDEKEEEEAVEEVAAE